MKKSLLATVAAAALMTTTGMAAAAEGGRDQGSGMRAGSHGDMNRGADSKGGTELKGKSETTGAGVNGQEEPRAQGTAGAQSGPSPDSNEVKHDIAPKAGSKADADKSNANKATVDKAKSSTTGQGSSQIGQGSAQKTPAAKSSDNDRAAPAAKSATDEKSGAGSKSSVQGQASTSGAGGGSVSLTSEQKTKIRTTVLHSSSAPKLSRSSINFNIRVGTVVPRTVHFVAVPETIVEVHPAWRGYRYFIVDEEIVIVEPSSFKIVAVLTV